MDVITDTSEDGQSVVSVMQEGACSLCIIVLTEGVTLCVRSLGLAELLRLLRHLLLLFRFDFLVELRRWLLPR